VEIPRCAHRAVEKARTPKWSAVFHEIVNDVTVHNPFATFITFVTFVSIASFASFVQRPGGYVRGRKEVDGIALLSL